MAELSEGMAPSLDKDYVLFVDAEGHFRGGEEGAPLIHDTTTYATATLSSQERPASAIDEETGEINWDCPCLQAALAPPCGEYFRAAFACFVASKTEPKGSDCLDKFAAMQDCFRANPEIYLREIGDEDDTPLGGDATNAMNDDVATKNPTDSAQNAEIS